MRSRAATIGLVAYLAALALLVLWPTHPEAFLKPQLLALEVQFSQSLATAWITYEVLNDVANVLLFVPLTLLAVLAFGRGWAFLIFAAGSAAAAAAELAQALFLPGRTPDVADILAGAAGSLLGVLIALILPRTTDKPRAQKNEAPSPDGTGE